MNTAAQELRLLKERELPKAMEVWDACFVNTPEFTRWYFETRCIPERVLGLFEDGGLVSNTLMIPYRMKMREKTMAVPFIVGAATLAGHRRKGHMESVLKAALEHMRDLGAGVTFLHPFRYGFYARLGWERATCCLTYTLDARRASNLFAPGALERVKRGDGERMRPIYQSMTAGYELSLLRGERECEYRLEETLIEGGFGLIGEDAYALCYNNGGKLQILELVGEGPALYPVIGAIAREPGAEVVEFSLPYWEAPPNTLMDERPPALEPYLMMRVVDVEKAFSGLRFGAADGSARIELSDPLCSWNNGVFLVRFDSGEAAAAPDSGPPDAQMDIGVLSMLISGYIAFDEAVKWGLVKTSNNNRLFTEAFTKTRGFVLEKY